MTTPVYGYALSPVPAVAADATVEIRCVGDPEREWSPVYRADGTIVGPTNPAVNSSTGRWDAALDANVNLTPANTYYELRTRTPGMAGAILERFTVPDQAGAYNYLAGVITDLDDLAAPTPSFAHNALTGRSATDAHPDEAVTVADTVLAAVNVGTAIAELRRRGLRSSKWFHVGHSYAWLYPDDPATTGMISMVANLLGAEFTNHGVSGSNFLLPGHDESAGNGGWVNLAHKLPLPARTYSGGAGFPARRGMHSLQTYLNDINSYGATLTPLRDGVKDSARFACSWMRAAGGFRHDEASTGQSTTGSWATTADDTNTPGTSYSQTTDATATWTVVPPSRANGCVITLVFLCDYVGGSVPASAITFTVGGLPATPLGYSAGFDTRERWPAAVAANGVMVARFAMPAGSVSTIVATTGAGGARRWGYLIERPSPMLLCDVARTVTYGGAGSDAIVANVNTDLDTVVAEFDALIKVIEMDTALAKTTDYFSDNVHPNQKGHDLVAAATAVAFNSLELTDAQAVLL